MTVANAFDPHKFQWAELRPYNLFHRCHAQNNVTCGKLLLHAKEQVVSLREKKGLRVCIFKVGVTSNPPLRFCEYKKKHYSHMYVICESPSVDKVHMLEAALISEFHKHIGCRNKPDSGGEGALNRTNPVKPPYFVYVVAGRADQCRRVG